MANEFPAPDPSARVEAPAGIQENPLQGHGVPGVEVTPLIDGIPEDIMKTLDDETRDKINQSRANANVPTRGVTPIDNPSPQTMRNAIGSPYKLAHGTSILVKKTPEDR